MDVPEQVKSGRKAVAKPDAARPPLLRLVEAAEDIFLAKGYHSATMADVAKAAGMSKKTIYTLVTSKAELFGLLHQHHQSLLQFPETKPDWTVHDILAENMIVLARFLLAPEQIAILRLIMAEYTHSPDLGRLFHKRRVLKAKSRLEGCIKNIAATRGCAISDPAEMAAMLFGMALGEFHLSVLVGYRAAPSKAVLEARVRRAVDIFVAGMVHK